MPPTQHGKAYHEACILVIGAFYHRFRPFFVQNSIDVRTKIIKVDEALGLVFGWGASHCPCLCQSSLP